MHPVPIVHGMTIVEYALMINGEHWLKNNLVCDITVIPCMNYTHDSLYRLPVKPSPNLTTINAVYLYPSLGLFEGTEMSIGRGTEFPFEMLGSPGFSDTSFSFIPHTIPGMSTNPKFENVKCYGIDLHSAGTSIIKEKVINLRWLIDSYHQSKNKNNFFNPFFDKLAGNSILKEQLKSGLSAAQIRKSWKNDLKKFRKIRKKYLLYE